MRCQEKFHKERKEYANNLLNSTEKVLTDSLAKLEKDISEAANIMQMSLEGTINNSR